MTSISDITNAQENVFQGKRGLRNAPSSASKRPALSSITNIAANCRNSDGDHPQKSVTYDPFPVTLSTTTDLPSTTTLSLSNLYANPNTSLSNALHYSFEDSSFCLSTSIVSLTSPGGLCSPMLVSSPDISVLEEKSNSKCFGEYADDIYANLKYKESLLSPPPGFIHLQPDINSNMRAILIDWLIEVAEEFQLHLDTLYLAVAYTDRYLSKVSVPRSKLQLVGTTSLYLAAKFEEIHPPDIGEFAYITDDTYTRRQIVKLEQDMLKVLEFQLVQPTIHTFLSRYIVISRLDVTMDQIECLAKYLCELSLLDVDPFSKYSPSVIAASAICLARHCMNINAWSLLLQTHTGYCLSEINQCLQDLHRAHALAHCHQQQAVRQKYMNQRHLHIATINSPETLPC